MSNFCLFKYVFSNLVLGLVVIVVLAVTLNGGIIPVDTDIKPISRGTSKTNVSIAVHLQNTTPYLNEMLDALAEKQVNITFFISGVWASQNEDKLKLIHQQGHEIGSLGYFYKDHKSMTKERSRQEIEITHKLVNDALGIEMTLFSPPFGSYNQTTLSMASSFGYSVILHSHEAKGENAYEMTQNALEKINGGSIILLNPLQESTAALNNIIAGIQGKGLFVTPVSQVL